MRESSMVVGSKYSFRKYQPLSLRFWHWLNALAILGLLGTVLLRKTFLSWRSNAALIEAKLQEFGTSISADLAKDIAVNIRNPMWDWHMYLGVVLTVLLLVRIMVAVFVEKRCPGRLALKTLLDLKKVPSQEKAEALHVSLVQSGYALFYLAIMLMIFTGLILNFKTELGFSKGIVSSIKEAHEIIMWFFVVFVGAHLVGIVKAEVGKYPGLVSDMIHGGDSDK